MGKIASALGLDMGADEAPASEGSEGMSMDDDTMGDEEKPKGAPTAEVLAMKQFDRATSPEAKAQALKDFLEACGLY